MAAPKDLSGQRFGRLVVTERCSTSTTRCARWLCRCDCGIEKVVSGVNIGRNTNSCGCIRNTQNRMTRKHPLWIRWNAMIERCERKGDKSYPQYGGRGIKVCDRWHSFPLFLEDMEATFFVGASLDRFPDNLGDYEPTNVRWATSSQQIHNRRCSRNIETPWGIMNVAEAARRLGVNREMFSNRVKLGWTLDQLFDPKNRTRLTKWDRRKGAKNAQ